VVAINRGTVEEIDLYAESGDAPSGHLLRHLHRDPDRRPGHEAAGTVQTCWPTPPVTGR
jgi:hypothetical protein